MLKFCGIYDESTKLVKIGGNVCPLSAVREAVGTWPIPDH